MDYSEIYHEVVAFLSKEFDIDESKITLEAKLFEDLELDSIDAVDMIVYVQKKTGKRVNPETFKAVRTVQDVVEAIAKLQEQN